MLGGVCGGMGGYFDVDPTIVRVIAVILGLASAGWAILAYIIGWIIIPEELPERLKQKQSPEAVKETKERRASATWTRYFPGLALIFFGALLLVHEHWYWFSWHEFWPIMLIGLGLVMIFWRTNSRKVSEPQSEVRQKNSHHNEGTVS
jgi:phage shock protein PspC (stress-responsive transcriptional regulator)